MAFQLKSCATCGRKFNGGPELLQQTSGWRVSSDGALWFECSCNSTLMLPKGKYDWYAPEKFMSPEALSLFNSIPSIRALPHLKSETMKWQQIAKDPNVDVTEFARVLRHDPLTSANILKMASSIKAARGDLVPITSVEHAVVFLGRRYVSYLLLATALQDFKVRTQHFSLEDFWQRAYVTGAIAEALGTKLGLQYLKDELYISGTLCNMGKLVGAIVLPEQVDAISLSLKNARTTMSWCDMEAKLGLHPHTTLGEIAAVLWGLPDYVAKSASTHHNLANHTQTENKEKHRPALVALANQLTHWVMLEPERIEQATLKSNASFFGWQEADIEEFLKFLAPAVKGLSNVASENVA